MSCIEWIHAIRQKASIEYSGKKLDGLLNILVRNPAYGERLIIIQITVDMIFPNLTLA
jgi:hypothetical protein